MYCCMYRFTTREEEKSKNRLPLSSLYNLDFNRKDPMMNIMYLYSKQIDLNTEGAYFLIESFYES